jgi:hypothetical protein
MPAQSCSATTYSLVVGGDFASMGSLQIFHNWAY